MPQSPAVNRRAPPGLGGIGLVLHADGASAAWQAGLVRALHEMDLPLTAVAGSGLGALHAAVLAGQQGLYLGHMALTGLWQDLIEMTVLEPDLPALGHLLACSDWHGDRLGKPLQHLLAEARGVFSALQQADLQQAGRARSRELAAELARAGSVALAQAAPPGLRAAPRFSPALVELLRWRDLPTLAAWPLDRVWDEALAPLQRGEGLPLWLPVPPAQPTVHGLLAAAAGPPAACALQQLPLEQRRSAVRAATLLPVLFGAPSAAGAGASRLATAPAADAGAAGSADHAGADSAAPLAADADPLVAALLQAGCAVVLVSRLQACGPRRPAAPRHARVIELRPEPGTLPDDPVLQQLGFDIRHLGRWQDAGHQQGRALLRQAGQRGGAFGAVMARVAARRRQQGLPEDGIAEWEAMLAPFRIPSR